MVKLKVISFFFSLLLIMQMLPLQKIGKVLAQNQWTEELPDDVDESGKDKSIKFNHTFLPPTEYTVIDLSSKDIKALAYIHFSDQIPSNHATEVVSPPPDIVS